MRIDNIMLSPWSLITNTEGPNGRSNKLKGLDGSAGMEIKT